MKMEDEELPSESTSSPVFRQNVQKTINSTNANTSNSSSSKGSNKIVNLTSTTTKRKPVRKSTKQIGSRKKKPYFQSKRKSKRSATSIDSYSSTDDDMYVDSDQTTLPKSRSNNSSIRQIKNHAEENLLDLDDSFASCKTDKNDSNEQSDMVLKTTTQTKEDVWKYFTRQKNGAFKCILCTNLPKLFPKTNESTDTNLRSHLGRIHKLTQFLYPSQRQRIRSKQQTASYQRKNDLNTAAIEAIVQDSHTFNLFRKPGMQKFLSLAVPGYRGPTRQTVVKRLKHMYKKHRSTVRHHFSTISDISLSADVCQSNRRYHFIRLSAHYYDDQYLLNSTVIAFRRFLGKHSSNRIEHFIINEIEKLNLQTKIRSLTTNNGYDIPSASQNKSIFGIRISCLIHMLNLIIRNGLWLFNTPKGKSSNSSLISNNTTSIPSLSISNNTKSNRTSPTSRTITFTPSSSRSSTITINIKHHHHRYQTPSTSTSSTIRSNSTSSTSRTIRSNPSSSTSNTTKSDVTTLICIDSSAEDDDYDFTRGDNDVTDDSGSDITSEHSDADNSSYNASTAASSSNDESDLSSLEDSADDDDLNSRLLTVITEEEEFLHEAFAQPTVLLTKVHSLLKRLRKLVAMIRKSSVLNRYIIQEIKSKLENSNRRIDDQNEKPIKYKKLTLDMRIRCGSTFVMISRFLLYSSIITSLIHDPSKVINLKPRQCQKLKKLSFTSLDWSILKALENVLAPFNHSINILSTRHRPTLSISQSIVRALTSFLTITEDAPLTLENLLKKQLLLSFNFYFEKHVSDQQSKAILISSFLDPSTHHLLTCNDKKEAETIIFNEAEAHYAKLNSNSLSSSSQSSITKPLKTNEQESQSSTFQNLFLACGMSLQTATPISKALTIEEEIAQYIATLTCHQSFSQYWSNNKDRLPILSSIVRQYNIICATSIDCESAFSIAGFV